MTLTASIYSFSLTIIHSIDRYQDSNGPNVGHRLVDFMCPFFPLVRNWNGFMDTESLGYVYDYVQQQTGEISHYAETQILEEKLRCF